MEAWESLVARIYEAGALPERWSETLEDIASAVGARGSNLIAASSPDIYIVSTPSIAEVTHRFDKEGWNENNTRVSRLLEKSQHPGFLTDLDLHTAEEIKTFPMYRDFLTPLGADAGAATVISGAANDGIVVTFEGFQNHDAAFAAVPILDRLRPHIAKAAVLSARVQAAKARSLLTAFDLTSTPIALLDRRGRILSATESFLHRASGVAVDGPRRLRLIDSNGDTRFVEALKRVETLGQGASIALRDHKKFGVGVLQIIPARRDAQDLFSNVVAFAVLSRADNSALPSNDLISALFDLTPSEARVARCIAEGKSVAELATLLGVSRETVRSHLKKALSKTSTKKQSELAALLSKLS